MTTAHWIILMGIAAAAGYALGVFLTVNSYEQKIEAVTVRLRAQYLAISNRIRENTRKMPKNTVKHFSSADKFSHIK